MSDYFVYVLMSMEKDILYKGFTDNLDRRLKEHNSGMCQTTKSLLPLKLVFVQVCETQKDARELEKYLKSGYGREIIRELIEMPPW